MPDGEARHWVVRQLEAAARLQPVGSEDVRLARLEVVGQRIVKIVNLFKENIMLKSRLNWTPQKVFEIKITCAKSRRNYLTTRNFWASEGHVDDGANVQADLPVDPHTGVQVVAGSRLDFYNFGAIAKTWES